MPLIGLTKTMKDTELNLMYGSFRNLFYRLVASYKLKKDNSRKSILRSLDIMLPKIYDMAKFHDDKEEMDLANEMKEQIMLNSR